MQKVLWAVLAVLLAVSCGSPVTAEPEKHGNQVCNILRIKLGFMSAFNIIDLSEDLLFVFCL